MHDPRGSALDRVLATHFAHTKRNLLFQRFVPGGPTDADPARRPEGRLMLAVLQDAVAALLKGVRAPQGPSQELVSWFLADDVDWPFSFVNICEMLDVDAARLRTRLRRWCDLHCAAGAGGDPVAPGGEATRRVPGPRSQPE